MHITDVCILGGTGFVGRHLAARLAADNRRCRVISRHPERHRELKVLPQLELVQARQLNTKTLAPLFADCDAVINLIGILNEGGGNSFRSVHVELVDQVVDACHSARVPRLLHMSALNADEGSGTSEYLRSKGEGENRAHTGGGSSAAVTSFRPSVIFGPDDSFFNRFARLLRLAPGIFPLACPGARFAPVFIGDVAKALARALEDENSFGKHYELCGPREFTLQQLVEYTARVMGLQRWIIGLGELPSRLQARLLGLFPSRPFSYDNYLSMQQDSVCTGNGLEDLGIVPTDIDAVVPAYLAANSSRGEYQRLRTGYWASPGNRVSPG